MPLTAPIPNQFNKVISSTSTAAWPMNGVLAGNNTLGSEVELISGANFTDDAYGIMVTLQGIWASAAARAFGVNIYATTGVLLIERLICSGPHMHQFFFPLYVKSGQSIRAAAAANAASLTVGVHCKLFCNPSKPDAIWCGQKVTSFGKHATNLYTGTAVATGASGAKGNFVALGSATAERMQYWEYGYSLGADTTYGDGNYLLDLAEGTSTTVNDLIMLDMVGGTEGTENSSKSGSGAVGFHDTKSGQNIYGRAAKSSTTGQDPDMIAYGVS